MFCIFALTKIIVCYSKQVNYFLFSIYLTIYFFTLVKLSILVLLFSHAHKTCEKKHHDPIPEIPNVNADVDHIGGMKVLYLSM